MPGLKLIKGAKIVNEGKTFTGNVLIEGEFIKDVTEDDHIYNNIDIADVINANGKTLIPGLIDDQVHFREPGLTHKADIYTESKAAIAGGVTSYMEMPNTVPQATTLKILEEKYSIASEKSLANYSFYLGATNDNIDEILKLDGKNVCGIKLFMGSSTGNMLVDNEEALKNIFSLSKSLIAVHCEDESIIKENLTYYKMKYGDTIPVYHHPDIRTSEACYKSSSFAVNLARKFNTRLHILHISTARELDLLDNSTTSKNKQITGEVCVHHLWFDASDYNKLGTRIKWNPAIKDKSDKDALINGLISNKIDVIATDHAPHTLEEKENSYLKCPSGGPLVQHSLQLMIELFHKKKLSLELIVEKMCHTPAEIFKIEKRGFIRKGYYADLVLIDLNKSCTVERDNILYKCKWSPFEGITFNSVVSHTFLNGNLVYENGKFNESVRGKRLQFSR